MVAPLKTYPQKSPYDSPWTPREKAALLLWQICWPLFCGWTPSPLNGWRLLWLRIFGARISGRPFVHQRARIAHPWNLTLHDRACLGDRANAYCLGPIELQAGSTVAQEAYLCTGTHDFSSTGLELQTAPIVIGPGAFICARAFILPGISIGAGALVGACAVVTRDVPPGAQVIGNPAHPSKSGNRVVPERPF
jgi:putative colanic acid biosynthesis acetyltransferase WcaF